MPKDTLIKDLTFKNTEQLGRTSADSKAVYDIYCEDEKGERFIVELKKQNKIILRTALFITLHFPSANRKFADKKVRDEKIKIAKKCLQKGMSAADVADLTGLSEDVIGRIA